MASKNIKMNKNAFSLIELIVWITISMLLMVSIGVFVSSWMSNIFQQQQTIKNSSDFSYFISRLNSSINSYSTWFIETTSSWIMFKSDKSFWNGWFTYIWTETLSWVYCNSDSETPETNSLFIKTFIPFEEQGEDIFNDMMWWYSWSLTSIWINISWTLYTSYQKEHSIKDDSWNIIIWKQIFWEKFEDWVNWTWVYLNSPTWLTNSWNILFISDTLNDRILYYDTTTSLVYKLLDESDWLNEPTGLHYENSENALYIANSWNGEILKYSSDNISSNPTLTMSGFTESINRIEASFSWTQYPNLLSTWNWSIIWNSTNPNYLTWSSNTLNYYFVTKAAESNQATCTWTETIFSNWKPSIYCTRSWSWEVASYPNSNINQIDISNLNWFSNTWSYFVNLKLFDWASEQYSEYFPYFTNWDNNILTKNDNTLEVVYSWLNYPTWIWWTWSSDFNEFLDWTYSDIAFSEYDELLKIPLKELIINYNPNDLLSVVIKYYKSYDCYNPDKKSEKIFIINKNLKN